MALRASFFLLALCAPAMVLAGQPPSGNQPGTISNSPARANTPSGAPASDPPAHANPPSAVLRPSLDMLHTALGNLSIDGWKASAAIRTEADGNLRSVQRDLQSTLPSLLAAADAAPDSTAKTMPVFRNVDALYDVMLRLDAAGRLAAPKDQVSALDQALASLSSARSALGDEVQANAEAQEAHLVRLQAALKAVPPPAPAPPPPASVACTPPPVKKRTTKPAVKKPATTPTSAPANSQNSSTPSH
jgi:hypothetical protein